MLCQDLQPPLVALRSPQILCWLPYKPLSDQNHQLDWNLSSSQDANVRPISFSRFTISRASSSSSSSLKNRRKKTRTRRWRRRRRRRWGPTYLHEYLGVQFSTTEQQFMHWSAHKKLQEIVNNTTTTTSSSSSSSLGEIWQQKTKVRLTGLQHWSR